MGLHSAPTMDLRPFQVLCLECSFFFSPLVCSDFISWLQLSYHFLKVSFPEMNSHGITEAILYLNHAYPEVNCEQGQVWFGSPLEPQCTTEYLAIVGTKSIYTEWMTPCKSNLIQEHSGLGHCIDQKVSDPNERRKQISESPWKSYQDGHWQLLISIPKFFLGEQSGMQTM
jgi:hypothetical protein